VEPQIFPERQRLAGFEDVEVSMRESVFRFRERKPARGQAAEQELQQLIKGEQCV
jgi:hypothetical protein